MIRGFYTARTGLMAQQTNMDIVSNNIANVNTVGYKAIKSSFTDLMYQNLNRVTDDGTAMVGHGTKINKTDLVMTVGGFTATNYALDFVIPEENGFFAVVDGIGEITYTRAGNFIISNDDGEYYLAAANGDRVLDEDGNEIEIEWDEDNNMIFDQSVIGVYRFNNPYGLEVVGNNRFAATDLSGEAEALETPKILNGYLENSSVELSAEMVKVIESSKAFAFNSRMVQVADEIEQTINSLR